MATHSPELKGVLSDMLTLVERALGSGHAGDLPQRIASLPETEEQAKAQRELGAGNPRFVGVSDADVRDLAAAGDLEAQAEHKLRLEAPEPPEPVMAGTETATPVG